MEVCHRSLVTSNQFPYFSMCLCFYLQDVSLTSLFHCQKKRKKHADNPLIRPTTTTTTQQSTLMSLYFKILRLQI